ncbi:hypothetical protein [Nocardia sp. CC227C]|uniref:hypothetical protein n=1 Tax=Nocardia sp. CC227C TaxID=3044562 RepID=UPI00278C7569|nr:hypothetical protein [Nocardia sp. CC227C]
MRWRDIVDDGRYAVTGDDPPVATGVDAERSTVLVNSEIAEVVRAIRKERA